MARDQLQVKLVCAWWYLPFQKTFIAVAPFLPVTDRTLIKLTDAVATFAIRYGIKVMPK